MGLAGLYFSDIVKAVETSADLDINIGRDWQSQQTGTFTFVLYPVVGASCKRTADHVRQVSFKFRFRFQLHS